MSDIPQITKRPVFVDNSRFVLDDDLNAFNDEIYNNREYIRLVDNVEQVNAIAGNYVKKDGSVPFTGDVLFEGNEARDLVAHTGSIAPTAVEGKLWYDTVNRQLKVYNGSIWKVTDGAQSIVKSMEFTAVGGQTVFDISSIGQYVPNVDVMSVYLKNAEGYYELLDTDAYIETDSTTVTLTSGATSGDEYFFKWIQALSIIGSITDESLSNDPTQVKYQVQSKSTQTLEIKDSPQSITPTRNTPTKVQYEGLTLVNQIENGDFSNGTTGWSTNATIDTITFNNNITFNGLASNVGGKYQDIPSTTGDKIFISFDFENDGVTKPGVTTWDNGSFTNLSVLSFNEGKNGFIVDAKTNGIRVYFNQDNGITYNNAIFDNVIAINITSLNDYLINTLSWTSQEVEDYMLWNVQQGHFDGMKHLDSEVTSVGKNLININKVEEGNLSIVDGSETVQSGVSRTDFIEVKQGEVYITSDNGVNILFSSYRGYDENKNYIKNVTGIGSSFPIDFDGYIRLIRAVFPLSNTTQLERGTTATSYEEYKESTSTVSGKRLPNQVADTESLQKVSDEYALQSGDIVSAFTGGTNVDSYNIDMSNISDILDYGVNDNEATKIDTDRTIPRDNYPSFDDVNMIGRHYIQGTFLIFVVAKGTYPDLATAQADLAGTKIIYELATPIERTPKSINVYENGQVSSNDFLPVNLTLDSADSLSGQVEQLIKAFGLINERINKLETP